MVDTSKLRTRLGTPPADASSNLTAPELAPVPQRIHAGYIRRDGRAARRTHRTLPFATKVSPEFDNRLRDIAERDDLMLVEVLEKALDAYEAAHEESPQHDSSKQTALPL